MSIWLESYWLNKYIDNDPIKGLHKLFGLVPVPYCVIDGWHCAGCLRILLLISTFWLGVNYGGAAQGVSFYLGSLVAFAGLHGLVFYLAYHQWFMAKGCKRLPLEWIRGWKR